MKMPFSMPDEFAMGWLKAGFNFWRALPITDGQDMTVVDANGNDIYPVSTGARNFVMQASTPYRQKQTELWSDYRETRMRHELGKTDNADLDRSEQPHGARSGDGAGEDGVAQSRPNWAWTGGTRHYDWMDSHGPFAGLD